MSQLIFQHLDGGHPLPMLISFYYKTYVDFFERIAYNKSKVANLIILISVGFVPTSRQGVFYTPLFFYLRMTQDP